ncbi:hypothetical protein [Anaerosporobacter sp.]
MENARELLITMAAVTCFCIAVSLLVYITKTLNHEVDLIKENIYAQHAIYPYR